ncbi:hypothetical protein [Beijerinckia indica]|uniref:Uncharacterized protein n=1 Tax=Beijerinckia indica subsp. indica (strain ATCC 9039 / DSM 1715 / NCIMB 8712) TaxID=395963 RepID=B2IFT5_BEII9|nr:hypothetical protein [Beijerinckia indica]ACB94296.1 conserved hypothetical protein [Beijerinckia indica subsp. indica ATCC 9039]
MVSNEKARAALTAHPLPESPWIEVTDEAILIKAGFSEQLLQLLRWVPKVQWRPDKRYWVVPLSGAETVRAVLPEITRLSELTLPGKGKSVVSETPHSDEEMFREAARLLFGAEWQRETALALGRNETELARWLLGEHAFGDADELLRDMLALMRQRASRIEEEADRFQAALERRTAGVQPANP